MKTYQDFSKDEFVEDKIDVTCIGGFDGLHKGHIELIKKTKKVDNNYEKEMKDILRLRTYIGKIIKL